MANPGPGVGLRSGASPIYDRIGGSPGNHVLMGFMSLMDDGRLVVNHEYQRARVWTDTQAEDFVGFMLEGGRPPAVYVWERPTFVDEIVDGQQRLMACQRFINGEIGGRLTDGRLILWRDMDAGERRSVMSMSMPKITINENVPRARVLRLYLKINRGGTPHTDDEISRVRELLTAEES